MGMNQTPASERVHIGFFGKRNAGKSSVMNAVTGQELSVVSQIRGTTTDPVYKSMELLPLGPVVMMDTPGIDDEGELGGLRVKKSYQVLNKTDAAVLVIDGQHGPSREDFDLLERIKKKAVPCLVAFNKADLVSETAQREQTEAFLRDLSLLFKNVSSADSFSQRDASSPQGDTASLPPCLWVSAARGEGIQQLKECLGHLITTDDGKCRIVGDLIDPLDLVVLVVPIDKAAPKGRLILPQQQTIRDILEANAVSVVVKEHQLKDTLESLGRKPRLVITDSQAFGKVSADTPGDIPLTSFSILFARYKGNLEGAVRGVAALNRLKDGDTVLISEGCTHHRQCDDIGTVKLPRWITDYTKKDLRFAFTSGTEFPDELSPYSLVVHCGGCMLNEREMRYRASCAADQSVPMTNYGILIAHIHGILKRSLQVFPEIAALLEEEEE